MKRIVRALLLTCIICILVSVTYSGINDQMMTVEQYALYTQNLIMDTQYEYRNKQALIAKGNVIYVTRTIYNLDKLNEFCNNVKARKKASVRVIIYTTEGAAVINDLEYNGKKLELTKDNRRDIYASIKDRKVEKTKYDDFIIESLADEKRGDYTAYYLISGEDKKQLLLTIDNKTLKY